MTTCCWILSQEVYKIYMIYKNPLFQQSPTCWEYVTLHETNLSREKWMVGWWCISFWATLVSGSCCTYTMSPQWRPPPMPDEPSGTPGKLPYRITSRGEAWLRTVILWEDLETAPIRSPNSWHRLVGLILAKARGGLEGMAGWGDVNLDSWKVIYPPGNYHIPPGEVGNIIDSNMPNIRGIC